MRLSGLLSRRTALAELLRYGAASALALAADFGCLLLLTEAFAVHYLISAGCAFVLGMVVIYLCSIHWVFAHRGLDNVAAERTLFLLIGLAGLALNQVLMFSLTDLAGLPYQLSKLGAAGMVFSFNFAARKRALFTWRPKAGAVPR